MGGGGEFCEWDKCRYYNEKVRDSSAYTLHEKGVLVFGKKTQNLV